MKRISDIKPLSDAEDAAIRKAIESDPDTWELSEDDIRNARPFSEVFPELYAKMRADIPVK